MAKLVADTDLEKEFTRQCVKYSERLNEMWAAVKALSEESGVPVGPYVPQTYKDLYVNSYGADTVDPALVRDLTGCTADESEFWYSSSQNC